MKHIVVLTGAGISAESGLSTFRDKGGLWDDYAIEEVALIHAWTADKEKVLNFYNIRRKEAFNAEPNGAHVALASLEMKANVSIITQNVDSLHERAGSSNVLHLHGRLDRAKSEFNERYNIDIGSDDIRIGDLCPDGHQLRPDIVWFGEEVPNMLPAINLVKSADLFIVIGTSLTVYPAASLLDYVRKNVAIYVIDPSDVHPMYAAHYKQFKQKASAGIDMAIKELENSGFFSTI
ncbi:MAG: NAD-dependent deacylase [Bacteroidetes bacterium]|nr:NAD-dependent deacylase [Bacteroidota bacterium]